MEHRITHVLAEFQKKRPWTPPSKVPKTVGKWGKPGLGRLTVSFARDTDDAFARPSLVGSARGQKFPTRERNLQGDVREKIFWGVGKIFWRNISLFQFFSKTLL